MNTSTLSSSTLGHSPGQRGSESQDSELTSSGTQTSKILNQMKCELQEQKQQKRLLKELHLKRVLLLRKELEYLKITEWRYQPIDRFVICFSTSHEDLLIAIHQDSSLVLDVDADS